MDRCIDLSEFYEELSRGQGTFPKLSARLSRVLLRKGPGDLPVLDIACDSLPSLTDLMLAEASLAAALGLSDLALHLQLPAAQLPLLCQQKAGVEQWIKSHAGRMPSFELRLFALGRLRSLCAEELVWQLPPGISDILSRRQFRWLEDFWQSAGPLPLSIRYEQIEVRDHPFASLELPGEIAFTEKGSRRSASSVVPPAADPFSDIPVQNPKSAELGAPAQCSSLKSETDSPPEAPRLKAPSKSRAGKKLPRSKGQLLFGRRQSKLPLITAAEISDITDEARLRGEISDFDLKQTKSGRYMIRFLLGCEHAALRCLFWCSEEEAEALSAELPGAFVEVSVRISYNDRFEQDFQGTVIGIEKVERAEKRRDDAPEKRVELHIHSKFSTKDACSNPADIVRLAAHFGHEAVAITDHGGVQGFPEASEAARALAAQGKKIKLIFGMEGYLVDDGPSIFMAPDLQAAARCRDFVFLRTEAYQESTEEENTDGVAESQVSPAAPCPEETGAETVDDAAERQEQESSAATPPARVRRLKRAEAQRLILTEEGLKWGESLSIELAPACRLYPMAEVVEGVGDSSYLLRREDVKELPRLEALRAFSDFIDGAAVICPKGLDELKLLRREGFCVPGTDPRVKFNPCLIDLPLWLKLAEEKCLDDTNATQTAESDIVAEAVVHPAAEKAETGKKLDPSSLEKTALSEKTSDRGVSSELAAAWEKPESLAALVSRLWQESGAHNFTELNEHYGHLSYEELRRRKQKSHHIILLANDELGLYHLYRLVSLSNLENFYFRPRIPRSSLRYFREGLTLGAACVYGEVFSEVLNTFQVAGSEENKARELLCAEGSRARELAAFYDYLEIQPLDNNRFLLSKENSGIRRREDLQSLNRLVLDLGRVSQRPVCATCDSHFLNAEDDIYRRILTSDMGFSDTEQPAPLYFRNTGEMLEEFSYLDAATARKVVIDHPRAIAARVREGLLPFPDGSFPPKIPEADERIRKLTMDTALQLYGREGKLPESIAARLDKELDAIISNGYAVMYDIARELCRKSNEDGYIVGSRGSVGSSLVATFCGITEVNPLQPHYICPHCHHYEEENSGKFGSGFDLPAKNCPECGTPMKRDGQDIPFATFLGFKGNKQPDIDLNFSGEYQASAHAYLEEMFGRDHTFKAGTIQGYADKQSVALVRHYSEDNGLNIGKNSATYLSKGIQGIKVSTGQHPGGIVVVPREREVYDFTPIQYPADKKDCGIITTHFDFNAMHDTILKIDALGHDDPTMLRMLSDMTGVEVKDIPIPDEKVMALFQSTEAIGIKAEDSTAGSATIGLPEVGTIMAREMIKETHPTRFYDLVQLAGLSHGTDVWKGNAQELIREGTCTINEVIGCRDSIMTTLIHDGLDPEDAFKIMEKVRKGRGLDDKQEAKMREHQVPEWYIESCKKIKYLFPKAHAAAYSISTQRIAWFKVYYPEAYYCSWFTVRGDDFNADDNLCSPEAISARCLELRGQFQRLEKPEQKKFYILEIIEEMNLRGIHFLPLDLDKSEAHRFTSPAPGEILPPLDIIPGISRSLAQQIVEARQEGPFRNCEELARRCHLGQAAMDALRKQGLLKGLPESAQLDFFALAGIART